MCFDAVLIEVKAEVSRGMIVGVEEKRLFIEALATLAYRKNDMVNFILKPSGVPREIYIALHNQRDASGRGLSKRQTAPLILDALEERGDYADIVGNLVKIAAHWEKFELCDKEYEARAVKAKAQEILKKHQDLDAEESARKDAARQEQDRVRLAARKRELGLLLAMFDEFALPNQNAQRRGYLLQDLLNRLFAAFEIPVYPSFTRNEGAEQIDGAFYLDGWFYLTECRWRQEPSNGRDLDGFQGQISRSGKQAMGLFLSINGWSDNVPQLLKQNTDKATILMPGYDLRTILAEELDLRGYILAAVTHLSLHAEPYLSVREYLNQN